MKWHRSLLSVYAVELTTGVVLGLGFFLFLLWLLQIVFPGSTSLGDLVRTRGDDRAALNRIAFDESAEEVVALLSDVRHDVRDRPSSSVIWSAAGSGQALGDLHAVQTYSDSTATITFDSASRLELAEKSVIVVRKPRRAGGSRRRTASVLFMDGLVRARLGRAGASDLQLEVVAGSGSVRAAANASRGADVSLATDGDSSSVSVHEGAAEVVWGDRTTVVPGGFMVSYDAASAPGSPVALPGAVTPTEPADGQRFRYRTVPPRVSFGWPADESADAFRVQIATDAGFANLVYDGLRPQPTFHHGNLEAGEYHWRVFGYRGPLSGPAGPSLRFVVEQDQQPPALSVEVPEGTVRGRRTTLRGTAEVGCRVFVGESGVPVDESGRFELEIPLNKGYNFVVIQAIDPAGNTAFSRHTILAEPMDLEVQP